jgi:hypothetical protein
MPCLTFLWGICSSCQTVYVSFPLCHSVLLGRGVICLLHNEEEGQVPSGAAPWRFGRVPLFSLDYGGVFWLTCAVSFMIKYLLLKLRASGVPLGSAHLSHVLMDLWANALSVRPCAIFSPTRLCINVVRFVRIHIRRAQGCLKLEMVGAWRPCVRSEDSGYIPGSLAAQPCGASLWKVAHGLGLCGMISKGKVGNTQALVEVPRHAGMGGRMDGYPD